jgi:hypothetical protein
MPCVGLAVPPLGEFRHLAQSLQYFLIARLRSMTILSARSAALDRA